MQAVRLLCLLWQCLPGSLTQEAFLHSLWAVLTFCILLESTECVYFDFDNFRISFTQGMIQGFRCLPLSSFSIFLLNSALADVQSQRTLRARGESGPFYFFLQAITKSHDPPGWKGRLRSLSLERNTALIDHRFLM